MNQLHHYPANLSSVYIQKRNYELHKNKLNDIEFKQRSTFIKSVSPSPISIINKPQSKNFVMSEKNNKIKRENTRLLDKLIQISQRNPEYKRFKSQNQSQDTHSKSFNYRKTETQKIYQENQRLANRLLTAEAVTKKSELEKQYQQQRKIKQRITRSDWQLALPQSSKNAISRHLIAASFDRFQLPYVPAPNSLNQINMSLQFPIQVGSQERSGSVNGQRTKTSFSIDRQNFRMNTEPIQQGSTPQSNFYLKNPYLQQQLNQQQKSFNQDIDEDIQIDLNDSQINLEMQNNQFQQKQYECNQNSNKNMPNNNNQNRGEKYGTKLFLINQQYTTPNQQHQILPNQQFQLPNQYGNKENLNKLEINTYSTNRNSTNSIPPSNQNNQKQFQQSFNGFNNQNFNTLSQPTVFNRTMQLKNQGLQNQNEF
ncbi:hypothetical protein TTHERM_00666260 (macronuclear) [Tetrahymena thermophila SB210]|uniref:Uncharacterized protein n=1 Tax=Tetrahymena thermophila (strain SB210) TaxID=312017 RepID=Q23TF6_TETTS|nr:hypothetical protein TTHERM_00666260 [Tetrahymena thermophila SB210]EAR99750.2 hypothetical protein TTHERM_00666260 [Tetrahymena thermophila SB210]|eukprot:XP_001019995.2 hypothetical protein TTHERM_00666260 [Tetrahymena thermophila SB210]